MNYKSDWEAAYQQRLCGAEQAMALIQAGDLVNVNVGTVFELTVAFFEQNRLFSHFLGKSKYNFIPQSLYFKDCSTAPDDRSPCKFIRGK